MMEIKNKFKKIMIILATVLATTAVITKKKNQEMQDNVNKAYIEGREDGVAIVLKGLEKNQKGSM